MWADDSHEISKLIFLKKIKMSSAAVLIVVLNGLSSNDWYTIDEMLDHKKNKNVTLYCINS